MLQERRVKMETQEEGAIEEFKEEEEQSEENMKALDLYFHITAHDC
jgi:hypothetical protein